MMHSAHNNISRPHSSHPLSTSLSQFSVVSLNIYGLNSMQRQLELSMFLNRNQPAVVVIQEPKLNFINDNKQPPRMTHYHAIHFMHPTQNTGIIMYIHESVSFHAMTHIPHSLHYHPDRSRTIAAFVWISHPLLSTPVVIGGVYVSHQTTEDDVVALTHALTHASSPLPTTSTSTSAISSSLPVFLMGDFNSRHPMWDNGVTTTTTQLDKWIYQHLLSPTAQLQHVALPKLTLLNTCFTSSKFHHTHVNTSHYLESVLDLAMSSHPHMISSMRVLSDSCIQSDHYPISITFHTSTTSLPRNSTHDRTKWRVDADADTWKLFASRIDHALPTWTSLYALYNTATSPSMSQTMMDDCWSQLMSIITDAAKTTIGSKRVSPNHADWWSKDPNIETLHHHFHVHDIPASEKQQPNALVLTLGLSRLAFTKPDSHSHHANTHSVRCS